MDREGIFTIGELRKTLGTTGVNLCELTLEDQEFRDYGSNPLNLLGTVKINLASNDWATSAFIKAIRGNRQSKIGRHLMAELGPQLVQKAPGEQVMVIQEENAERDNKLNQ